MQSRFWLMGSVTLSVTLGCTGPDRPEFVEDLQNSASSATSQASNASTMSGSDGGDAAGGTGNGGTGPGSGGTGPGSGGGTTSVGGGGAGGDGPVCDIGSLCVPDPPAGWTGPVALFEGPLAGSLPPCNLTPYGTQLGDYFAELDAGDVVCECSCDGATGIVCSGDATLCYKGSQGDCIQVCTGTTQSLADGECAATATQGASYVSVRSPIPSDMGACEESFDEDIPTPVWGLEARVCNGSATTPAGCDVGQQCVPLPGDSLDTLCIVRPGEETCPDEVWTVPHVRHATFEDSRECSGCACGTATSMCGGRADFISSCSDPLPLLYVDIAAGQCDPYRINGNPPSVQYGVQPSGSCDPEPGSGEQSGAVTVDGTITLCCMQ